MTRSKLLLLAVVGAVALAFLIERLIVTDGEAITSLVADDVSAILRDDWDAVTRSIDDDYSERGRDRAQLVAWARDLWGRVQTRALSIDVQEIRVAGDHAAARIVVRPGGRLSGLEFAGRLEFVRRRDGWRIDGVAADDASLLERVR